ncbi:MAG TPA: VPLPA-CTERM-specific exosortase XrtD [Acidobacteriota bacterium]|nr:VPLPA-CTERM-specific exosortase XrtD [Acidobacteriota bacterium]
MKKLLNNTNQLTRLDGEAINLRSLLIIKRVGWVKIALYGPLLVGLYYSALTFMVRLWDRPEYNYCYLVPFVVLYLIWEKRRELIVTPSVSSWMGVIPFVFGLAFFWLGELGGEYLTLYFSSWLVVIGLCWLHLGWQKMKIIAFALFMILTMFPLPSFLYNKISVKLQLISSQLGVTFLQLYGMSAYREGNVIDLGFAQLQVVEACSGLRSLISLTVLSILLAYFFKAAFWKRFLLLISVLPLSIFTNSMRIAITGVLYEAWGAKVAEGFFHGFSGWLIFMFSLAVLLFEIWILKKIPSRKSSISVSLDPEQGALVQIEGHTSPAHVQTKPLSKQRLKPQTRSLLNFFRPPQFIVALFLLAGTFALSQGFEFREKIPIKRSFDKFPIHVGEWIGTLQSMEQRFIDELNLTDYVIIDYKDRLGREINFYVAYYESQRKGESIHSPETCLPGSGWTFEQAGTKTLAIPGHSGGLMRVNRAFMQKGPYKQLSYFWFPQRGRVLTNAYQLKIFAFWDALTKQRTDGALVRVITPVYESEGLEDAEARIQAFTKSIVPVLDEYIPGKDVGK